MKAKAKAILSLTVASALVLSAIPAGLSASAAAAVPGDVDMDGLLTGHDTAMVSRYVFEEDYTLTEEQQALADVTGDGVVDTADTEWLHANEVYALGDVALRKEELPLFCPINSAYFTCVYTSICSSGKPVTILPQDQVTEDTALTFTHKKPESTVISQVQLNLMDANADGQVTLNDAYWFLYAHALESVGYGAYMGNGNYLPNGVF